MRYCFSYSRFDENEAKSTYDNKREKYAVLSGIANAAANYSTIALAGYENASIMYPAVSAGTILATVVFGTVVFKEKLKCNQMIAMLCGIISVICLKM